MRCLPQDHRSRRSSPVNARGSRRSETKWTERFSHWQMTGSCTKDQGTPKRHPWQCDNNWIAYPDGVTTPDLSSIQTRHKHRPPIPYPTRSSYVGTDHPTPPHPTQRPHVGTDPLSTALRRHSHKSRNICATSFVTSRATQ